MMEGATMRRQTVTVEPDFGVFLLDPNGGGLIAYRTFEPECIWTGVERLMFHWTLKVGLIGDRFGYADRWCYATEAGALAALAEWNAAEGGEPGGWHKHPASGRLRPHGDPAGEYVERDGWRR